MNTKFFSAALVVLALGLLASPAEAAKTATKTTLKQPAPSVSNDADIARLETYLNALRGFQANFVQINDSGEYRHGTMSLLRPGKMRVTYDAPSKDFIVADGSFINIWDGDMQNQTSLPLDSSLGDLLLRKDIQFSGDITVTDVSRAPARIAITIIATKDPNAGKLTFVFEEKPLKLRQWQILDPQGRTTSVSLENMHETTDFSGATFTFTPPNFGKKRGSSASLPPS